MKNILKKALTVVVVALACYGTYSLTINLKSYISYKITYSNITRKENVKNGIERIPNLKLINPNGDIVSLYDKVKSYRYVILSFGSIYCENCHTEYKILQEKNELDKLPNDIAFYLCVPEEGSYINAFKEDTGVKLSIYTVNKKEIDQCGMTHIPTTVIIGKDYKIKWYIEGFKENTVEQVLKFIKNRE